MTDLSPELRELAAECGVATEYWDWRGKYVPQPAATIVAGRPALGIEAAPREAAAEALAARRMDRWSRLLPPCVVTRQGQPAKVDVHVDHGTEVQVWIDLETGGARHDLPQVDNWEAPREIDGRLVGEGAFTVPEGLPLGDHTLRARSGAEEAASALIVTPTWLGVPERMGEHQAWGLTTQLYSVRSRRSWGVGDLADLADLAVWSAQLGAGFVLVNPLHAAEPVPRMEPSPYLPTTRRFANPLYLRVELIPEYAYLPAAGRAQVEALRADLATRLDGVDAIDRDSAWQAKQAALRLVYAVPRSPGRELAYQAYRQREGAGLDDYATWCALAREHGADWSDWPEPLRHPGSPAVAAFRAEHADEVDFHRWLQWVLDEQLDRTQAAARRAGMVLGVMHDLAVGVHP